MYGANQANLYNDTIAEAFGSTGYIDIAQIKLEPGNISSPFAPKLITEEESACQRYCLIPNKNTPAYNSFNFIGVVTNSTTIVASLPTPVSLRTLPIITLSPSNFQINIVNPDTHISASNVTVLRVTSTSVVFSITASGLSLGAVVDIRLTTDSPFILDSEIY